MRPLLEVRDLHAEVDGERRLQGLSLTLNKGEIRVVAGPGGGALVKVLMGHPSGRVTAGVIRLNGEDIAPLATHQRARRGMFLAFRRPPTVPGVTVAAFLRAALTARLGGEKRAPRNFRKLLKEKLLLLKMDADFGSRFIDGTFTEDERVRFEALQLAVLNPVLAILDGTEAGRDAVGPESGVLMLREAAL